MIIGGGGVLLMSLTVREFYEKTRMLMLPDIESKFCETYILLKNIN